MAGLHGGRKARAVVEREQDVRDRRAVGHDEISLFRKSVAAVFPRNRGGLNSPIEGDWAGPRDQKRPRRREGVAAYIVKGRLLI
jgi:hypothetical protein